MLRACVPRAFSWSPLCIRALSQHEAAKWAARGTGMVRSEAVGMGAAWTGSFNEQMAPALVAGVRASAGKAVAARDGLQAHEVYRDARVQVVSDEAVTQTQAKALATRIEKAYDFDKTAQKWPSAQVLDAPLTVAVLTNGAFGRFTGDTSGSIAGVTTGPNLFVMPDRVLGRRNAQDENTIAHELGHVQDFREAGKRLEQVPIYLQEGKAYILGENYPLAENMKNPHIQYVGNALKQLTGDQARDILKTFRTNADEANAGPKGFWGEVTGALFVEFLRTRMGGTGSADAVPKLASVTAAVGGGESYGQAFHEQFGVTPAQAESSFIDYVQRTEGQPVDRFRGTLFSA